MNFNKSILAVFCVLFSVACGTTEPDPVVAEQAPIQPLANTGINVAEHTNVVYADIESDNCIVTTYVKSLDLAKAVNLWEVTFTTGTVTFDKQTICSERDSTDLSVFVDSIDVPTEQFVEYNYNGQPIKLTGKFERSSLGLEADLFEDVVIDNEQFSAGDRISLYRF